MKSKSARIFILFLLTVALISSSTVLVSAGKRADGYVEVVSATPASTIASDEPSCSITFNYGWDGSRVHAYFFYFQDEDGNILGSTFGYYPDGDVVKTLDGQETIDSSNYPVMAAQLVPGSSYYVTMVLYNNRYRELGRISGFGPCSCP